MRARPGPDRRPGCRPRRPRSARRGAPDAFRPLRGQPWKKCTPGLSGPLLPLGRSSDAVRRLEQLAEARRFEEVPAPRLALAELELGEDRRGLRRPRLPALAPKARQPVAQLAIARLGVEDAPDHQLGSNRAVPVVLLEPEGDVERRLLPQAVELAAEAQFERGP